MSSYFGDPGSPLEEALWPTSLRSCMVGLFGGNVALLRFMGADRFADHWIYFICFPGTLCFAYFLLVCSTEDFVGFRDTQDLGIHRATNTMLFLATGCTHAAFPRPLLWKLRHAGTFVGVELTAMTCLSLRHSLGTRLLQYDLSIVLAPFLLGVCATHAVMQSAAMVINTELPVVNPASGHRSRSCGTREGNKAPPEPRRASAWRHAGL
jgi:hypothetical protein